MIKPKELEMQLLLLGFKPGVVAQPPAGTASVYVKGDTRIHIYTRELTPDYAECFVNGSKFFTNAGVIKRASKEHVHV